MSVSYRPSPLGRRAITLVLLTVIILGGGLFWMEKKGVAVSQEKKDKISPIISESVTKNRPIIESRLKNQSVELAKYRQELKRHPSLKKNINGFDLLRAHHYNNFNSTVKKPKQDFKKITSSNLSMRSLQRMKHEAEHFLKNGEDLQKNQKKILATL